jgi:hypothetical protein
LISDFKIQKTYTQLYFYVTTGSRRRPVGWEIKQNIPPALQRNAALEHGHDRNTTPTQQTMTAAMAKS